VFTVKSDDGQRKCSKHVEFYSKNKFEELVHLVGFIIRRHIYILTDIHDEANKPFLLFCERTLKPVNCVVLMGTVYKVIICVTFLFPSVNTLKR